MADWDCLRGMVDAWEGHCGVLGDYGMQHTRFFANLCNSGVSTGMLEEAARSTCVTKQEPVEVEM